MLYKQTKVHEKLQTSIFQLPLLSFSWITFRLVREKWMFVIFCMILFVCKSFPVEKCEGAVVVTY